MKKLFTLLLILASLPAFCGNITLKVDVTGQDVSQGVYITGHLTQAEVGGGDWNIRQMTDEGDMIYSWDTTWAPGDSLVYYFLLTPSWDNYLDFREEVPAECDYSAELAGWEGDRGFVVPPQDTVIRNVWGSCDTWGGVSSVKAYASGNVNIRLYPNPSAEDVTLVVPESQNLFSINVIDISGKVLNVNKSFISATEVRLETNVLPEGVYFIKVYNNEFSDIRKLIIK
ncbi:MAG: T9SS type A sorting domain-containing protein [Bacteroidales bacterium]|nr:MAG: T9SS type A sorting domain-containing protein [Bacteroidales bacterium]